MASVKTEDLNTENSPAEGKDLPRVISRDEERVCSDDDDETMHELLAQLKVDREKMSPQDREDSEMFLKQIYKILGIRGPAGSAGVTTSKTTPFISITSLRLDLFCTYIGLLAVWLQESHWIWNEFWLNTDGHSVSKMIVFLFLLYNICSIHFGVEAISLAGKLGSMITPWISDFLRKPDFLYRRPLMVRISNV